MDAADVSVPKFPANGHIRDFLNRILRDEADEYWVVDEKGLYLGIAHQRDLLTPPRLKIILVDHNEPRQAIAALEEAELLEILDHHRLGNPYTHTPIRFTVDIVRFNIDPGLGDDRRGRPLHAAQPGGSASRGIVIRYAHPDLAHHHAARQNRRREIIALGIRRRESAQRGDHRIVRQSPARSRRGTLEPQTRRSGQHGYQIIRGEQFQIRSGTSRSDRHRRGSWSVHHVRGRKE